MPDGYRELRSRFFIDSNNHGTSQLGHDLAVHCNIEMTREFWWIITTLLNRELTIWIDLGSFLPAIFEEFKSTK